MGFDPLTFGILSGIAGFGQSMMAGQAANQQAKYNAAMQERQAGDERERLKVNSSRMLDDKRREMARMELYFHNSGASATSGTPLAVLGEVSSRLDEQIEDFATRSLAGISRLEDSARITRWSGKQAARAGVVSGFGTLLSRTASGAYGQTQWNRRQPPGGTPPTVPTFFRALRD